METGKVLLGVLAGVAVGATLGILFAPDKGSNTQKKITEKSQEYADALTERCNELLETAAKKYAAMRNETGGGLTEMEKAIYADLNKEAAKTEG